MKIKPGELIQIQFDIVDCFTQKTWLELYSSLFLVSPDYMLKKHDYVFYLETHLHIRSNRNYAKILHKDKVIYLIHERLKGVSFQDELNLLAAKRGLFKK